MTTRYQSEQRDKSNSGNTRTTVTVKGTTMKMTIETMKKELLTRGERREAGYHMGIACSCLSTTGSLYTGQGLIL